MKLKIENNIKIIFELALDQLGLTERSLLVLAERLSETSHEPKNIYQEMGTKLFMQLCHALCIDTEMFTYGYNKEIHRFNVGKAIFYRNFSLPRTFEVDEIYRDFSKMLDRST